MDGFHLYAYWGCPEEELPETEALVLKEFRRVFQASQGREFFLATSAKSAYLLIRDLLESKDAIWRPSYRLRRGFKSFS